MKRISKLKLSLVSVIYLAIAQTTHALKIHGNWCGPYHPNNFEYAHKEPLDPYLDSTDKACMKHDFIYSNYWSTIEADQMNLYLPEYPFEKQFQADLLLIHDIEEGLVKGEWGCEGTGKINTYPDRVVKCKRSKMEGSLCNRIKPKLVERMFSRVIQMAMMVKIKLHYKIGMEHENPTICEDLLPEGSSPASPSSPGFLELPDFCSIQYDFARSANLEPEPKVDEKIENFFKFFTGETQKRRASQVLVKYVKACNLRQMEAFQGPSSDVKPQFVLNDEVIEAALQAAIKKQR